MTEGLVARLPARARVGRPSVALACGAGSAAALAVALAAAAQARETRISPIRPDSATWRALLVAGLIAAFVLYLLGLAATRRRTAAVGAVAAVAAVIQLAPLATPMLLSRDAYIYWDYGRIAVVHHGNPFRDFPNRWPDDPAYKQMASAFGRLRSPYGPAWVLVDEGAAKVSGTSVRTAGLFFRLLAAASMLVIVGVVARSTRSAYSTALVGWNPLLALHFAGGGHSDAAMMALVAVALALVSRHPRWSGAAWAGAVAIKVAALAFLGVELVYRVRKRARSWLVGLAVAAVVALAVSLAIFGATFLRSAGPISNQLREANSVGLPTRLTELGLTLHTAEALCVAAFAVLYLWILREAWRGRRRFSLAAGGLCLAVAWLMPWYASWPVVLAAFDLDLAGTLLALGLTGYLLLDVLPI
jgi:Glycosyltransferase family 87